MIDFYNTWLPGILSYSRLIIEQEALKKAWAQRDLSSTSVYYPGELFEQIFGDLDSENMRCEIPRNLGSNRALADALDGFLSSLSETEEWISSNFDMSEWAKGVPQADATNKILDSAIWRKTRHAAKSVVELGMQFQKDNT